MPDTENRRTRPGPERRNRPNRRKLDKNNLTILAAAVFIVVVLLIAVGSVIVKKYTPTKERVALDQYFNIQKEDDMAVILDNKKMDNMAKFWDGHVYLEYELVHDSINQRFYWDANENILRYTTPADVISVNVGSAEYTVSKQTESAEYVIVKTEGDKMYLALDFVQKYTNIDYKTNQKPNRVLITKTWGEVATAKVKKDTQIRQKGGIKSPIVSDVKKGDALTVLESGDNWSQVCSPDGMIGYVKNNGITAVEKEKISREFEEPEFKHLLKDKPISLGWHQVTNQEANGRLASVLQSSKGINVMSPTWFYLNDNQGNIHSLASRDYVDYCHQNGIEVWALVSNLENPDVDTTSVLTHTSTRDYLVNQIIAAAIESDIDGINLDFEALSGEVGDAYIQFVRELSIKCENNNLVLSVDNYVPSSYTAFYNRGEQALFADYVIVMAYDEHTRASEDVGPAASLGFVKSGIENTLKEVPANQVIMGIPFYSRVWELTPKEGAGEDAESTKEGYLPYTFTCVEEGMQTVENRFTSNGGQKSWSEEAGQNYVEYQLEGKTYKIWVEDEVSLEQKLNVMKDNALAGAAYWKMGLERPSAWDMIIKYVN